MPKNDKRVKITLECTECKRRNYITMKSKVNDRERLEMKKYCSPRPQAHAPTRRTALVARRAASRARKAASADNPLQRIGSLTSPLFRGQ